MSNENAVAQVQQQRGEVEFIPFGADTKIKLSVKIIKDFVAIPTKSGALPDDRDCMKFMMLCRARKLNPFEGDCFLQGYDGRDGAQFSLITAHQAFLKRAEVNPEYDGMKSGVIVKNENDEIIDRPGDFMFPGDVLLGGWAVVFFKTRKHTTERRLNLSTFDQGFGRWQKDKAGMIVKCAEADALRSSFPTMLGGLYGEGELATVIEVGGPSAPAKKPNFGPADGSPKRAMLKPEDSPVTRTVTERPETVTGHSDTTVSTNASPAAASEPGAHAGTEQEAAHGFDPETASEFQPRPGVSEELNNLLYLCHKSGIDESALVAYCKTNKLMKLEQSGLGEISTAKLVQLAKAWDNIAPMIKN